MHNRVCTTSVGIHFLWNVMEATIVYCLGEPIAGPIGDVEECDKVMRVFE